MIFKTFDSDIDKWTAKIGILGKSFNELGTAVNNAFESVIDNLDNFDENVGFWESLKNNLFSQKDNDKDWIKNSLGEIISLENIDSYISELKPDKVRGKLQDIFDWKNIIYDNNNDKTWQDYFDTLKDGEEKYIPDLIKNTNDLSKLTGDDLVQANQKARESAIAHNAALKQQTLGAKAATVGMKALSSIGNMAAGIAISWGVSKIFEGIDYLVNYEEKQKEAFENAKSTTEECVNAVKKLKAEMSDTSSKASSLSSEFAKLVQGVDPLTNENKSLSTESYERFLEVNNQLAELFPSLTKNYDENGNAILGLSGNVDSVTASIERLVEQQNNLAKADIRKNLEGYVNGTDDNDGIFTVLEGYKQNVEDAETELEELEWDYRLLINNINDRDKIFFSVDEYNRFINDIKENYGEELANALKDASGIDYNENSPSYEWDVIFGTFTGGLVGTEDCIDFSKLQLDDETKEKITESYNTLWNDLSNEIETKKSELEAKNKEMSSMMMIWIEDLDFYKNKKDNPEFQKLIENLVNQIDWTSFGVEDGNLADAKQLIQQMIINPLTTACIDPDTKLEIMNALNQLTSFDFSHLNYKEAAKQIQDYLTILMNAVNQGLPDDQKKTIDDMYEMFGLNGYKDIHSRLENNIEKIADKGTEDYNTLTEYTKNFTQTQAEAWLEATNGAKDANDAIEKYRKSLTSTPPSFTDSLSQVQSLSEGLEQLNKIYADVSDKGDFDWSSILSNEDFKEKFGSLDRASGQLGNAYDEFMETVSKSPDDIAACQKSFDNLTTAYIIHSGKLKGITTDTQDATVAMLEQMGVSNALQMVTARLSAEESYNAAVKDNVALSSENLEDATWSDINTILEEGRASKESSFYLANLALSKINLDTINLNESGNIDQICGIAEAAGSSAEYVDALRMALNNLQFLICVSICIQILN